MTEQSAGLLPTDCHGFAQLREAKMIYVDKTQVLCDITTHNLGAFLSSPCGFGRRMAISTLAHLYSHGAAEGLAEGTYATGEWQHPTDNVVISLDLGTLCFRKAAIFRVKFCNLLRDIEVSLGYQPSAEQVMPDLVFDHLVSQIPPHSKLVLLINNYDSPLLALVHDAQEHFKLRNALHYFFKGVERKQNLLRFVFVTGLSDWYASELFGSVISDLNRTAAKARLFGFTRDELLGSLRVPLRLQAAKIHKVPFSAVTQKQQEELADRIVANYGGYSTDGINFALYPTCVMRFLSEPEAKFRNFWLLEGGEGEDRVPKSFIRYVLAHKDELGTDRISSFDISVRPAEPALREMSVLLQSGWLSARQVVDRGAVGNNRDIEVGYPNQMMQRFAKSLRDAVSSKQPG
ncbi:MAG: AAA family ATPase [Succinivibrionaceae bacterium]|nr:AAA family ATPase [Succinivibrionaceae bacterium]